MSWLFLLLYLGFVRAQADSGDSQPQRNYFPLPQTQHFRSKILNSPAFVASPQQVDPESATPQPAQRKRVRIRPVASRRPAVNVSSSAAESVSVSLGSASFSEQLSFSVKRATTTASAAPALLEEDFPWLSAQRRDKRVQVVRAPLRPSAKREGPLGTTPQPLTNVTPTLSPQISTTASEAAAVLSPTSEDTEISTTSASPPTMHRTVLHETVTSHKATTPTLPVSDFTLASTVGTTATSSAATSSAPATTTITAITTTWATPTTPATTIAAETTSSTTERLTTTASTPAQPESDDGFSDFPSRINVTKQSDPIPELELDADYQQDAKHEYDESAFVPPKQEPFLQFHREIRHLEGSSIMITVTPRKFTDQTSVSRCASDFV